jgi:hypothetical protein
MAITYEPLATNTLSTSAATVTFSSISGSYTDLILVINGTLTGSAIKYINFNGVTTTYSTTVLYGAGGTASSARYSEPYLDVANSATNPFVNIAQIMDYSNSTTFKTYLARQGAPAASTEAIVGLWRSTSAITSLSVNTTSNAFATGTTFTLYGIKEA